MNDSFAPNMEFDFELIQFYYLIYSVRPFYAHSFRKCKSSWTESIYFVRVTEGE